MPNFSKQIYKLFIWIQDIKEIYIKLFTNIIKLFTNFRKKYWRVHYLLSPLRAFILPLLLFHVRPSAHLLCSLLTGCSLAIVFFKAFFAPGDVLTFVFRNKRDSQPCPDSRVVFRQPFVLSATSRNTNDVQS